ncbi:MAG: hypothetical protein PHH85_08830 [Candidatus Methanoperedens sp.]|nr:hypothetical protein [Candidatus Methanoperedens sp.]
MEKELIKQKFLVYAITIILSILILTLVLELWRADLGTPLTYDGDTLFNSMTVKGMMENGWYLYNPFVGAPFGQFLPDFPMADNINFLILKIISLFVKNYAIVLNLFFILTFPLTAVTFVSFFSRAKSYFSGGILYDTFNNTDCSMDVV